MVINFPPYLKKGDTIGIVCPAGYMAADRVTKCISTLENWGYNVKLGSTVGGDSLTYFSGTDEQRLADLQAMLDDKTVNAILFGRGGYGCSRIIDSVNFRQFKKTPKWIIGYSDITVFHTHLYNKLKTASLHAPMAGAFNDEKGGEYLNALKRALKGTKGAYTVAANDKNREGKVTAELVGGNLTLLANVIGTPSDYSTKGKILFIEEIGEYLYASDRLLWQLKRSGKLDKLAGLVVGGFTDSKDTERPFGKTIEEIITDLVAEYDYPVCFNFPVSHGTENYALKIGGTYTLNVEKTVRLKEL